MNTITKENCQTEKVEGPRITTTLPGWVNGDDVCFALRISKRTLQNYRDRGILPFSQAGRKIYYKLSDILDYLDRHYIKANFQKGNQSC